MSTLTKEEVISFILESPEIGDDILLESISRMSMLRVSDLTKKMESRFGVTAAAPVIIGTPSAPVEAAPQVEEKTEFDVILLNAGDKKIQVIKEVRAMTGLSLKEAKDLVDGLSKAIKESIPLPQAEEIKKKLESAGATVEIK